jgi:hypothetical protein
MDRAALMTGCMWKKDIYEGGMRHGGMLYRLIFMQDNEG